MAENREANLRSLKSEIFDMLGAFFGAPYRDWWLSYIQNSDFTMAFHNHWLVRKSAATAFGLGLVSSLHCVGMCGPLALALPLSGFSAPARYLRPARADVQSRVRNMPRWCCSIVPRALRCSSVVYGFQCRLLRIGKM